MFHDIALFWLVVAGFLLADNVVVVPRDCDLLRVGWRGTIRYDAGTRLHLARREVVLLNPVNLFERVLITTRCFGDIAPAQWRRGRTLVRSALPLLNALNVLGYTYLLLTAGLAYLSFQAPFLSVLMAFAILHALIWILCTAILIGERCQLRLSGYEIAVLCAETAFVPAYLMNLGKRALHRHRVGISALGLGLRQCNLITDADERAWAVFRLRERLLWLGLTQGHEVDELARSADATRSPLTTTQEWIEKAEACLKN